MILFHPECQAGLVFFVNRECSLSRRGGIVKHKAIGAVADSARE